MFGTAIPMLYIIGAFYFWLAGAAINTRDTCPRYTRECASHPPAAPGWIDRHNLLRRMSPPPRTEATLTRTLALYVFPLALALHVVRPAAGPTFLIWQVVTDPFPILAGDGALLFLAAAQRRRAAETARAGQRRRRARAGYSR